VVVVVARGGRASDAVDDSTGVAIEEESAGEEGVAAAAAPNPNSARGGRESFSFSFSFVGADGGCLTMGLGVLAGTMGTGIGDAGMKSTMEVIGLIGTLLEAAAAGVAAALVCAALGPLAAAGRDGFACLCIGVGVGDNVGVTAPEPEPALALVLESAALAASAQIAATLVTRPPRPPRADLKSYFTSI